MIYKVLDSINLNPRDRQPQSATNGIQTFGSLRNNKRTTDHEFNDQLNSQNIAKNKFKQKM